MDDKHLKKYRLKPSVNKYLRKLVSSGIGAFGIIYIRNAFFNTNTSYLIPLIVTIIVSLYYYHIDKD